MLTAYTEEVDEIDIAVGEIMEQLNIEKNLSANSLGIINCDLDFITSGFVKALSEKLPFDTVGVTTRAIATRGVVSTTMLSISVLTSDDVTFSVVRSDKITSENAGDVISAAYSSALGKLSEKPAVVLAYPPMITSVGSHPIVSAIFKAAGNTPVFGTIPCSPFDDHRDSFTIMNGEADSFSAILVLLAGNIHPDFLMVSIPKQSIQKPYGIITKSEGCRVYKINDMSFFDYLERHGFPAVSIKADSLYLIPFMVNFDDGTPPTARGLYSINDEGVAIFGNEMPVGKAISPGNLDYNGILETTEELMRQITLKKDINGILIYSCIARHILLGVKTEDELEKIIDKIGGAASYQACYSGGEICPVNENGEFINRMHNYTLIACVF
jgi:hypothetical protein